MTTNGHGRRLEALAVAFRPRPPGCVWSGRVCQRWLIVGDEPQPEQPERCERCPRPLVVRTVRLVGVDAEAI